MKEKGPRRKKSRALDLAELDRLFRPKILRYLGGMVGEVEAEDLVQDVFFRVSRALKNFEGRSQVSTWIYRIATNAAIDFLRKPSLKRQKISGMTDDGPPGPAKEIEVEDMERCGDEKASTAETSVIQDEMVHCLRKYIDKLPASQRAVIVLNLLEGMKNAEIAKILCINVQTVKIRLHRGRFRLIKELEAHCGWFRDARGHLNWDGKIL